MIVTWARVRSILGLSLPIVLVLLAQTLMGLINIAMVGHLGDAAVAGLGVAGALFSVLLAVLFGIDTGVQALVARRIGAGQTHLAGQVVNDALAIAVAAGSLLAVTGYLVAPAALRLAASDPAVVASGLAYLNAGLPMLPVLGASFVLGAYRNGAGTPLYSLLVVAIQLPCGAVLGYLLIFGALGLPRLETAGAGWGGTLAALVALAIHGALAARHAPIPGFLRTAPSWSGMRRIVAIGLPVGIQQSLVYLGICIQFWIIGLLGTRELAAMNIVLSLMLLSILPASGMGIAAATLVGAALGRGDVDDARRCGWQVAAVGALSIAAASLIVVIAPRDTLGLFIADPATIAVAAVPLGVMALGMGVDAFGRILSLALRGAGATRLVTAVAFTLQWGVQLPLASIVGIHLGYGLLGIAIVRLLLFAVESFVMTLLWRHGYWRAR